MFDGEKCIRCHKKFKFEDLRPGPGGLAICEACAAKLRPDNEEKRRCPVDAQEMVKRVVGEMVILDKCLACGGVWFDGGELQIVNDLIKEQAFEKAFWTSFLFW
jgi:NAD-dependent SIR2 family protein deacetylase